jgi:outer membrane protein TolC
MSRGTLCSRGLAVIVAVSAATLSSPIVRAQSAEPGPVRLTLNEAIGEALAHAPVLAAADARQRAAGLKATSVARTRFGQVDGVAALTTYQDDVMLRTISRQMFGPLGFAGLPFDRSQAHYGLTFQVPLYLGGRLAASIDVAQLQADQLTLAAQGARWEVRFNVTALYAAAQTADAVGHALDENLLALDATRRSLNLMVDQGRRANLDLLKLDGQVQDVRAERSRVAADAARARALLLALMGRDPASPVQVDPLPGRPPGSAPDAAALTTLALAGSSVRRTELALDEARRAMDQASGASRPTLIARGNWLGHAAPSLNPLATWEVGVAVTVPLFDAGARGASVASAREAASASASALDQARLDRVAQAVAALADLESAGQQTQAAEAGVAATGEAARVEQIRYDTGAGTIEDLLLARARDVGARASLARARGALVTAAARVNAIAEQEVMP